MRFLLLPLLAAPAFAGDLEYSPFDGQPLLNPGESVAAHVTDLHARAEHLRTDVQSLYGIFSCVKPEAQAKAKAQLESTLKGATGKTAKVIAIGQDAIGVFGHFPSLDKPIEGAACAGANTALQADFESKRVALDEKEKSLKPIILDYLKQDVVPFTQAFNDKTLPSMSQRQNKTDRSCQNALANELRKVRADLVELKGTMHELRSAVGGLEELAHRNADAAGKRATGCGSLSDSH